MGVSVPLEICIGFLLAWIVTVGFPAKGFVRSVLTAPLFSMEVAIGYLGVTLFSSQGGLISFLLGLIGILYRLDVDRQRRARSRHPAGCVAMDAFCVPHVARRARGDSQRDL